MSELTDFLLARIADDEAVARLVDRSPDYAMQPFTLTRVLAECETKRRIVRLHDNRCQDCAAGRRCITHDVSAGQPSVRYRDPVDWLTLTALALPYADHPDYREEWKP